MKELTTILVFCSFHFVSLGQQQCKDSLSRTNYFDNPSFETYSVCPTGYGKQDDTILKGWFCPRNNKGQCDFSYINYNCPEILKIFFHPQVAYPTPLSPFPNGQGMMTLQSVSNPSSTPEKDWNKKYIGTCANKTLKAGQTYIFSFYIGFGKYNHRTGSFNDNQFASSSPFKLGIFGHPDCTTAFPFDNAMGGSGCPAIFNGWAELGTAILYGREQWLQGSIEFTPQQDINALAIGPACGPTLNFGEYDTSSVYYIDQVALAPKSDFDFKIITRLSGNACTGNYVLQAPGQTGAAYQWYRNGVAMQGATGSTYAVPNNPGSSCDYTVNITIPNGCFLSLPYRVSFSSIQGFNLGNDTVICFPSEYTLKANRDYITSYRWQNGSTNSTLTTNQSGVYWVEVKDASSCTKLDSIIITVEDCGECRLWLPSSFTPNGDGLNDVFLGRASCNNIELNGYRLRIYSRWGQLIFESTNTQKGWDGSFLNKPVPMGTYVYTAEYGFGQTGRKSTKGTITVIR